MHALIRHLAAWALRGFGALLVLRLGSVLSSILNSLEHHPSEASVVGLALVLLLLGWSILFWRRGGQLIRPEVPLFLALIWVPIRCVVEALALAFFAVGLAITLVLVFGGDLAQESMRQVSLAGHLTNEHNGWIAFANWTLHSSVAAFFYGLGLRVNDGLKRLTGGLDRGSPRLL